MSLSSSRVRWCVSLTLMESNVVAVVLLVIALVCAVHFSHLLAAKNPWPRKEHSSKTLAQEKAVSVSVRP